MLFGVTSRNASKAYLEMVKSSYLSQSDECLYESVANYQFIDTGCFFGCLISLVVAVILTIRAKDLLKSAGRDQYMINIFPLYSLFAYIVLHMLMYAGNIYFWKRFRVNYAFIFGFKPTTDLGYKEILLFSSALLVLTLAAVPSNLEMEMDERTLSFTTLTELVPLGLFSVLLLIMICPLNIMYRASRFPMALCLCTSL
ncbi:hypothetical protein Hdeb2414_s0167g00820351 [Helianthus debilis subsp. tardiflorus]